MLESGKFGAALIGAVVSAVASLLFYAISFGEMRSDVKSLRDEVSLLKIELGKRARPERMENGGPVTKTDVCLRLVEALQEASVDEQGQYQVDALSRQIEKAGCNSLPNPSSTPVTPEVSNETR